MCTFYCLEPENICHLSLWKDQNRRLLTDLLIWPTKRFCSVWLDDENKPLVCCRIDQDLYKLFLIWCHPIIVLFSSQEYIVPSATQLDRLWFWMLLPFVWGLLKQQQMRPLTPSQTDVRRVRWPTSAGSLPSASCLHTHSVSRCGEDSPQARQLLSLSLDRTSHTLLLAFPSCLVRVPTSRCHLHSRCMK